MMFMAIYTAAVVSFIVWVTRAPRPYCRTHTPEWYACRKPG
jgi:hypothetical protein